MLYSCARNANARVEIAVLLMPEPSIEAVLVVRTI